MTDYKAELAALLAARLEGMEAQDVLELIEYPPNPEMGDFSVPCFKLSKRLRKAPQAIAEQLKAEIPAGGWIARIEAVSGYFNVFVDKSHFAKELIAEILQADERYGARDIGRGRCIVLDYSSPNIAKPFHIGHLRTTVIGNALYNIFSFLGFRCVGVNHLGDWGTQFGKLIVAYKKWGDRRQVEEGGIEELMRLYVQFHDLAEKEPELEDEARAWFAKLERGDEEAHELWKWFVDISLQEFRKTYELLGVNNFDSYAGESFYNDKIAPVLAELEEKQLLVEDDGAKIVRLDDYGMPPVILLKKDGSTLYHTRDIAAAFYRKKTYDFHKAIYVTDSGQSLHFKQWFKIIELMGYPWAEDLIHVGYGKVSLAGGVKLSTRKGNVVKLHDLLTQAIEKTLEIIDKKNPELENKEEVARQVGVGAVIFNDLSTNRVKDIVFDWDSALNFDGETGPYVQYTHARACSVLRRAAERGEGGLSVDGAGADGKEAAVDVSHLQDEAALGVIRMLSLFGERVEQAMEKLEPSLVSRYLVDLAQSFNRFYHENPILVDDAAVRTARLALVKCVQITLRNGLKLIGLASPEKI